MNSCKTFEELQALGTEKIHEKTHISRDKIELVLTKSYGDINKIQFMGFISILEREYGLDLSDIRQEFLLYHEENKSILPQKKPSAVLQPASNAKQKWVIAGLGLIAVLIAAGYFAQAKMANVPNEEMMQLTTAAVEVIDDAIEFNSTQAVEINTTQPIREQNVSEPQIPLQNIRAEEGLEIRPVYKVWAGMIDLASHEKNQMITKDPIKIDTTKNWLIVLGHGRVQITSSSGSEVLRESGTVWFVYENGVLKRLTKEEFIERNGGINW